VKLVESAANTDCSELFLHQISHLTRMGLI
jgi:hypothetical protein